VHHEDYFVSVTLLDVEDVTSSAATYATWVQTPRGRAVFDAMNNPAAFVAAKEMTSIELPAVAGVAARVVKAAETMGEALSSFEKQAIGVMMRILMEANGFKKTGIKRAIPHPAFTKGEVYAPV
tara:strand:- start:946 stop:1317 length:372 start_codon:yes stop_codon:yes gene_type:complete